MVLVRIVEDAVNALRVTGLVFGDDSRTEEDALRGRLVLLRRAPTERLP